MNNLTERDIKKAIKELLNPNGAFLNCLNELEKIVNTNPAINIFLSEPMSEIKMLIKILKTSKQMNEYKYKPIFKPDIWLERCKKRLLFRGVSDQRSRLWAESLLNNLPNALNITPEGAADNEFFS
jgi:hypothetical protein